MTDEERRRSDFRIGELCGTVKVLELQLTKERARSAKLIEALQETVSWWSEGDGLSAYEAAKEAIAEYEAGE